MAMSHQPNYMAGVPVKITEKYKPPPLISLPQSVSHRLTVARLTDPHTIDEDTKQQLSMAGNVMAHIEHWRTLRDQDTASRRERLRIRADERRRQIDEHQRHMLTSVSYPSAEDLSFDSSCDEMAGATSTATTPSTTNGSGDSPPIAIAASDHWHRSNIVASSTANPHYGSPISSFDTILMPTVVPASFSAAISPHHLTASDREQALSNSSNNNVAANGRSGGTTTVLNKINYADFENDTSSPFDNVELKTINDLDILAQVWNINTGGDVGGTDVSQRVAAEPIKDVDCRNYGIS